ncbi:helix-loop-helix DNA-binding domain-containing protein [Halteromyces radiatus]|uniref:helix-loop-helix DNA-binding domain-containing protein n=1 Tax=Halteromyces radiatus TaxID=101107 RepID=UPI00222062B8|nr:helix-loop-helix DNA-binding domain-containing protein [Halteromyces radiatus]KAI8093432.1 helix-loop-helix DNA-binding domain-containing protein [Halteromyces radiatus]
MNVNSYFDDRHYQQLLHDENDYMMPWFQNTSIPHTPALSHSSHSPHDCYASNDLLFNSISPQASFSDMYEVGSILIPSDDISPVITTSTASTSSTSSSSNASTSPTSILLSPPTPPTSNSDDNSNVSPLPFKKVAHNAIERRYRNNINDRIRELQQVVPALCREEDHDQRRGSHRHDDDDTEELEEEEEDGVPVAKKLNKATILQKATEYIQYLKYSQRLLIQENDMLQHMMQTLPGGEPLLKQFLIDKERFDQAEKERRAKERKLALQQQRINHQRMLKERAAQRAALMSPEERQRRRRRSSQQQKKKQQSISPPMSSSSSPPRLLSVFLGITLFAVPSTNPSNLVWKQHRSSKFMSQSMMTTRSWSDYWPMVRFLLYCFFITYLFILPFLSKVHIRRTHIKKRIY